MSVDDHTSSVFGFFATVVNFLWVPGSIHATYGGVVWLIYLFKRRFYGAKRPESQGERIARLEEQLIAANDAARLANEQAAKRIADLEQQLIKVAAEAKTEAKAEAAAAAAAAAAKAAEAAEAAEAAKTAAVNFARLEEKSNAAAAAAVLAANQAAKKMADLVEQNRKLVSKGNWQAIADGISMGRHRPMKDRTASDPTSSHQ